MEERDRKDQKQQNKRWDDEFDYDEEEIEAFFNEEEEEEEEEKFTPFFHRKGIKRIIAIVLSMMLLVNILAFWPQVYSLAAIQFLLKSRELSKNEEIQQYKEAVVIVKAEDRKGTGFNIADYGLIITNQHVVEEANQSVVGFSNGKSYSAEVIASDPALDIAILRISQAGLPTLKLATKIEEEEGAPVYVIGNPLFFNGIANEGKVLGMLTDREPPLMMIDAPIYKGNSGSPVINQNGEVIAVIFATTEISRKGQSHRVGLAVPVERILIQFQSEIQSRR